MARGKGRGGRPAVYGEPMVLTNFRLPEKLLEDLEEVRSGLGRPTLVEVVREALKEYVEAKQPLIRAVKKARGRHGAE
jgi:metal-responsive CopG/Arc/MetJ family transcriptional regulator